MNSNVRAHSQLASLRTPLRSHFISFRSGHLTGLKRKMPQLGIFPNCSLRSQLRLSPTLGETAM